MEFVRKGSDPEAAETPNGPFQRLCCSDRLSRQDLQECMVRRPIASEKEEAGVVCANVYGLRRSEKTPGQDGMRCARDPFSNAVLGDFFL
jgi:hypothetical protein